MFPFAKLTDGKITLRPFEFGEENELHKAVQESLPELSRWMSWATPDYTKDAARNYIAVTRAEWSRRSMYAFAITDADNGELLGGCSVSHIHPIYKFCNLGYWVRTPRHGNGTAGRAAKLAARFAFERAKLIRAEIVIAVGNEASRRVAEKIGAHYEGILLNRMTVRSHIYEAHMFSLLPSDFGLVAAIEPNPR
ncbi:MAG: N-acetyltransferase [Anaerolineaceae bacterium]|jgi:RimJ/RimL family protein N-acetyltransferase|nr:MAG: N-acetyltransferase [Anaerolineaceae bacterium]